MSPTLPRPAMFYLSSGELEREFGRTWPTGNSPQRTSFSLISAISAVRTYTTRPQSTELMGGR